MMRVLNIKNLALFSVFSGVSLYATVITPGGGQVTVGATTISGLGPLTFLQAITANFSQPGSGKAGGLLSGSLETAVYETPGGTLDFFYQVTESASNTKPISQVGTPIMDGFGIPAGTTSVYSLSSVTGLSQPTSGGSAFKASSIGASGLVASWPFGNNGINWTTQISAKNSAVTTILVVTTDATTYSADTASVQSGTNNVNSLGTASPAPEPGFYGILGLGLSGFAFMIVRRSRAAASQS